MKILRAVPSFLPRITGPAIQVFHIANLLEQKGYSNHLYYPFKVGNQLKDDRLREVYFTLKPIPIKNSVLQYGPLLLKKLDIKEQYDIVHLHEYRYKIWEKIFLHAIKSNLKLVFQPHGALLGYQYILNPALHGIYKVYDMTWKKKLIKWIDKIIVSTKIEKVDAIKFGFEPKQIEIIPVGYNKSLFQMASNNRVFFKEDKEFIQIGFVGRICKSRNVLHLIKAFNQLKKEYANIKLNIIGAPVKRSKLERNNYMKKLFHLAKKSKSKIKFFGELRGNSLFQQYCNIDIFVYPSDYENLGQPIIEAATSGCCVLSTNTGIAPEIIGKNERGVILENSSTNEIYTKLKSLLEKPKLIAKYQQGAYEWVKANYDWEKIISKYEAIYNDFK